MANTWTKIASTTTSSAVGDVTFFSIPNTYTDLCIKGSARMTSAYTTVEYYMILNNDGSTLYSGVLGQGYNTTVQSTRVSNTTYANIFNAPAANSTAGVYGAMSVYIPNYANTTAFKSYFQEGVGEINTTAGNNLMFSAGLYRSTAAIFQLTMLPTGNWETNTTFTLYGIKNTA